MNTFTPVLFACGLVFATNAQDTNTTTNNGLLRCTTPVVRDGKAHERFLLLNERAREAGTNAVIIFVGDSITEGWEYNGKAVWKEFYEPRGALNLGIGADHTQHVLWRLENGNIDGLKPRVVVLLIGVNNVPDEGNSPADILAGVQGVAKRLHVALPDTKVLLLGIFPFREHFNSQRGKTLQVNQALERWCADETSAWIEYLDLGHLFIDSSGRIPKEMMRDFLHPSPVAYRMWAEAMEPTIMRLLGATGAKTR